MKKLRRWENCQTHVTPRTAVWIRAHRTTRELVASDWSRNWASRSYWHRRRYMSVKMFSDFLNFLSCSYALTRWKICSRRMSWSLPFKFLTLSTKSSSLLLSSDSKWLDSPIAMSRVNLTGPEAPESHPLLACESAVKHSLCCPASAVEKVYRPLSAPFWDTTRWSLSKTSSTVIVMVILLSGA